MLRNSENHAEFSLKWGMKSNVGIAYSKSDWIAVRNLTKLRKIGNGTKPKNNVGLPLYRKNNKLEFEQVWGIENERTYSNPEKRNVELQ